MKRHLKLIIMASVLAVLIAGALIQKQFFPADVEADYAEDGASAVAYQVNDLIAESVIGIGYTLEGETLSFEKQGEVWVLSGENAPNIDSELVKAMVTAISGASGANKMVSVPEERLANYGLTEPSLKVMTKTVKGERVFLFGTLNKTAKEYYFCEEGQEDTVYTVVASAYEAFGYKLSELVVLDTLPTIAADAISGFVLADEAGETEIKAIKTPTEANEVGYEYSALRVRAGAEEEYSYAELYALAESVSAWKLSLVSYDASNSELYGFDSPRSLTVNYTERQELTAEGAGGGFIDLEKSFTLILGGEAEDGGYYCKLTEDAPLVYTVTLADIGRITD